MEQEVEKILKRLEAHNISRAKALKLIMSLTDQYIPHSIPVDDEPVIKHFQDDGPSPAWDKPIGGFSED